MASRDDTSAHGESKPASRPDNGLRDLVQVHRGCADLRAGRPLIVASDDEALAVMAVDGLEQAMLDTFRREIAADVLYLLVTDLRAAAIGLTPYDPTAVSIAPTATPEEFLTLAAGSEVTVGHTTAPASFAAKAALEIAKCAELLPALIAAPARPDATATSVAPLVVDAAAAIGYRARVARTLKIVAEAPVPLRGGIESRFIVFRDIMGGTAVAVMVGKPDPSQPLKVRVHSACATGDIFGSRRCDCGDQLRLAIERIDQLGGGCVIYLDQEGRGLGLANKLRAYNLQDLGLDTVDANTALGYHEDERDYAAAGRMIAELGWQRIVLFTNNPTKIDALRETGIEVCGRAPVLAPVNAENRRYLEAKAHRAGHMLDQIAGGETPVPVAPIRASSGD